MRSACWPLSRPRPRFSLVPESDESPSGLSVLSSLPSGLAGALQAAILPKPRVASLQASVAMSEGAVNVSLCGVCHVEPLSSDAVRDLITRCVNDPTERVMAVAVECDPQTLSLIRIAHGAIKALPMDRVQREGSRLVERHFLRLATYKFSTARGCVAQDTHQRRPAACDRKPSGEGRRAVERRDESRS